MDTETKTKAIDDEQAALKKKEEEEQKQFPTVSYFKLQFALADCVDITFLLLGVLGGIGMGVCFPLFAIIFGDSISTFGTSDVSNLTEGIKDLSLKLIWVGLGMLCATFLNATFGSICGERYSKKIKREYFAALLRQEQGFYDTRNAFEFSTKVQAQIKIISTGIGSKVTNCLQSLTMFIASYVVGFIVSWKLSLILLTIVPFMVVGGYCMIKALMSSQSKSRQYFEQAGGIAEEILYHIKTVASFSNFDYEKERFNDKLDYSYNKGKFGGLVSSLSQAMVFFLIFGSYALAIGVGAKFISEKEFNESRNAYFQVGDILTVIFTIVFGAFALGQSAPNFKAIAAACESSREFFFIRERKPEIDLSNSTKKPDASSIVGNIKFNDITFAYPSKIERKILTNLSLDFPTGTSTAIVGETGSGKSTIVNLLERLYDAQGGNITLDNIDIKEIDLPYLRSLIGYVPQEPVLFNTSLKENIIFGREGITDQEIMEACEKACVLEFLNKLDKGLNTKVGLKGSKLSGGQKQRVAIARAILKKPKILILDEATSALDYKSEVQVKKALDIVSKGVTTIIIAHRLTTIRNADRIIVLSHGSIAEVGNHESLYEKKGLYYNLVKSQEESDNQGEKNAQTEDEAVEEVKGQVIYDKIEDEAELTLEEKKKKFEEEEKEKEQTVKNAKQALWPIICESPCSLIAATFFATLGGVVWPVYGLLLAEAIFKLSEKNDMAKLLDDGIFLAGMFLLIAGIAGISNFFVGNLFSLMGEKLARGMRKRCFEKYLELHMSFFDIAENSPGALLTKLASDTMKLNGIALSMVAVIVQTLITLIVGVALAFAYCWQLSLICLGFVPFIIMTSALNLRLQKGFAVTDEIKEKDLGNLLSECVVNTKTLYAFNMQVKAVKMYEEKSKEGGSNTGVYFGAGFISGISQLIMFVVYSVSFYVGSVLVSNGDTDFGSMFKAIFTILFAAFGVGMMDMYLGDMNEAKKALISLHKVLSTESKIMPNEPGKIVVDPKSFSGTIEFKNVSFAYPSRPEQKIFKNLSLKIENGQQTAFVGFSGSGKSTVIQLIMRFYDVDEGEILINGINIKDYNLASLRRHMGLVMQEPVLFKMNVFSNICYGKLGSSSDEVKGSAVKAMVPRIDQISPDNNDALPVSGGEKQRIAIARCMLRDPQILLLDEATSALDKNVEEEVQKSLDVLMQGRTSIVIAHRLSTIVNSHKIFFIEQGEIKEEGTHEELLAKQGRYHSLYMSGQKK